MVTGTCDQAFHGHTRSIWALAVCESHPASGSADNSVKLWRMRAGAPWEWFRSVVSQSGNLWSLAVWRGHLLSGSDDDMAVRVWDFKTGDHVATLAGHEGGVTGLAVRGDRLFSASHDGTIRAWALGTWAALKTVEACREALGQYCKCLALNGSQLIGGLGPVQAEVWVWGLETLDLQHELLARPRSGAVRALLAVEGAVYAAVVNDVIVWRCKT